MIQIQHRAETRDSFGTLFTRDICKVTCPQTAEWACSLQTHAKKPSRTASRPFSLLTYVKSHPLKRLRDPFRCRHMPTNHPEQLRDPFHWWTMHMYTSWNSFVILLTAETYQKKIPDSFVTLFTRAICKTTLIQFYNLCFNYTLYVTMHYTTCYSIIQCIAPCIIQCIIQLHHVL